MSSSEMTIGDCGVTLLGRSGMRYREGSKTVFVDGEILNGPFDFVIYKSSIRTWEALHEPISEADQAKIIESIKGICKHHGLTLDIE